MFAQHCFVEEKRPKNVISYATRFPTIHLFATATMAFVICTSFHLMVYQATAAAIRQPRAKIPHLSFAAPEKRFEVLHLQIKSRSYCGLRRPNMTLL